MVLSTTLGGLMMNMIEVQSDSYDELLTDKVQEKGSNKLLWGCRVFSNGLHDPLVRIEEGKVLIDGAEKIIPRTLAYVPVNLESVERRDAVYINERGEVNLTSSQVPHGGLLLAEVSVSANPGMVTAVLDRRSLVD